MNFFEYLVRGTKSSEILGKPASVKLYVHFTLVQSNAIFKLSCSGKKVWFHCHVAFVRAVAHSCELGQRSKRGKQPSRLSLKVKKCSILQQHQQATHEMTLVYWRHAKIIGSKLDQFFFLAVKRTFTINIPKYSIKLQEKAERLLIGP